MKFLRWSFIVLVGAMLAAGCESGGSDDIGIEYINQSSYTITIEPTNQPKVASFALAPGQERKIKSKDLSGDQIRYILTPANLVKSRSQGKTVVLVNR